jgi:[ribosomal protein S18]-alanine N-acetyltransferase
VVAVGKDLPFIEAGIRPMSETDVAAIAELEAASYAFPWTESIFRDCLRVDYVCNVLEIGVVLAGYSIVTMGAGEAHLLNLCVREQFRFRGLGSQLLRNLMQQAVLAGARVMFLETRPSNQAAIRLYQAHNFIQIGVRRGYYQAAGGREDALVMRRTLI